MGTIRQCLKEDLDQVAALWAKTFRLRDSWSVESVAAYLDQVFFENPWQEEGAPASLIHLDSRDRITGFLGVVPRRMRFMGQPIRVAVGSQLMVDREESTAYVALALFRKLFSGPQDLTFSDGANDLAQMLAVAAGASVAIPFSLTWTRILRPIGYLSGQCRDRNFLSPLLGAFAPIGHTLDATAARTRGNPYSVSEETTSQVEVEPAIETVLDYLCEMSTRRALAPQYDRDSMSWLLKMARQQQKHGQLRISVVRDSSGAIVGWHSYYAKWRGVCEVLQFGAKNSSLDDVLNSLFRDARLQGATAVSGQVDPKFARHMARKHHCQFRWTGGVLAHSKNPDIANAIHRGDAFLTRLDGEWWMRFCDMAADGKSAGRTSDVRNSRPSAS